MYDFNCHRPDTLDAACVTLSGNDEAKVVAGGMTLVPTLKQRLARVSDLIDLSGIASLKEIKREGDTLVIGAMATHDSVNRSDVVKDAVPALAALAGGIGDAQVRNRGTIGGSVANADPSADYPAGLVGLGATVVTTKREVAADDFFTGMFETALEEDELIVAVKVPIPKRASYAKFPNPASRYAIVGVMVAETATGPRVAVTGAAGSVFRHADMESVLADGWSADAVADIVTPTDGLNEDIHASAEYRAHLVGVMAKRAVAAAG
jgi:carbon-monoxide dehydrogenase medium subunit